MRSWPSRPAIAFSAEAGMARPDMGRRGSGVGFHCQVLCGKMGEPAWRVSLMALLGLKVTFHTQCLDGAKGSLA